MRNEQGNVLFLILIAVVLFAALSYAVTQSNRGGGDADDEKSKLEIAEAVQVVTLLRTTIQRMILRGVDISDIELCQGATNYCDIQGSLNSFCTSGQNCLFSSEGGGLTDVNFGDEFTWAFIESTFGWTIDGHGSENILLFIWDDYDADIGLTAQQCIEFNKSLGMPTTLYEEPVLGPPVFADGIPSLSGQWDFCYDSHADPSITQFTSTHLLANQ